MGTCRWRNKLFLWATPFEFIFNYLFGFNFFKKIMNKNSSTALYRIFFSNIVSFFFKVQLKYVTLRKKLLREAFSLFSMSIYSINLSLIIFFAFFAFFFFFNKFIIFSEVFLKYFFTLVLVYQLTSIFIFIKKSYRFNHYTSSIQRFWKRSYILFWLIELFVFFLFFYLLLNHFKESNSFLDWKTMIFANYNVNYFFINQLLLIVTMIIINYIMLFFFKSKTKNFSIFFLILNTVILVFFYNEFLKFLYVVNYYYYYFKVKKIILKKTLTFSFKNDYMLLKTRSNSHYLNLIILIKFWHIVFIYLFYVFVLNSYLNKNLSYDNLSSNLQNFNFLLVFHLTFYVFFFKNCIAFFFSNIYYWFFVNIEMKKIYFIFIEFCSLICLLLYIVKKLSNSRDVLKNYFKNSNIFLVFLLKTISFIENKLLVLNTVIDNTITLYNDDEVLKGVFLYLSVLLYSFSSVFFVYTNYGVKNYWALLLLFIPLTLDSIRLIKLKDVASLFGYIAIWTYVLYKVWRGFTTGFLLSFLFILNIILFFFFLYFFFVKYDSTYKNKKELVRSAFEGMVHELDDLLRALGFSLKPFFRFAYTKFLDFFFYFFKLGKKSFLINFKTAFFNVFYLKKMYLFLFVDFCKFFFKKYIYTINHKRIALNYLYFCFFSAMSGLFLATIIRIELSIPGSFFFKGDSTKYLQVITSHGLIMVFFVVTPILFGFLGNFFIPYHVGSKDVAFPRLNSFGFWILFCGFIVLAKPASLRRQMFKYYDNGEFYKFFQNFFLKSKVVVDYLFKKKENKFIDNNSYRILNNDYENLWSFFFNENTLKKSHTTFVVQCNNASLTMTGWTFITPFSSKTKYTGFGAQDIATIAVIFAGISTTISFTNLLITRRTLSMPGIRNRKLLIPFISINLFLTMRMLSLIIPVLGGAMIMLQLDRHFGFSFFDYSYGGDPVLFHHLFWFFGHPEVYVVIIPSFGIINMVLPYFNFRRVAAKNHLIWATYIMAYMGFLVWGHHMYLIGLDHRSRSMYSTITVMISLPAVVKIVNWTLTLLNGALSLEVPIIFSFVFILFFLCGGLTGMWLSHVGLNVYVHDTFYIVAHFHFMFSAATFSAIFTCIYYYFWQIFSIKYSEYFAYLHVFYWFCGQWLTFLPIFWIGYNGCPRRYHDYPIIFAGWNSLASYGHIITILSVVIFFFMIFDSFLIRNEFSQFNLNIPRWHKRINYYIFKIAYINKNKNSLLIKNFNFTF